MNTPELIVTLSVLAVLSLTCFSILNKKSNSKNDRQASITEKRVDSPGKKKLPSAKKLSTYNMELAGEFVGDSCAEQSLNNKPNNYPYEFDIAQTQLPDKLTIMARDPLWLYGYWNLKADTLNSFFLKHPLLNAGALNRTLRIIDLTDNCYNDLSLTEAADNWYIFVNRPDHRFQVVLGLKSNSDSCFFPLLTSNIVATPRDSVSDLTDERWASIEEILNYQQIILFANSSSPESAFGLSSNSFNNQQKSSSKYSTEKGGDN